MVKKLVIAGGVVFLAWFVVKKLRGKGGAAAKGKGKRKAPKVVVPVAPANVKQAVGIIAERCKALKISADVRPIFTDDEWSISVMPTTLSPDDVEGKIPEVANGIPVVVQ